MKVYNVKNVEKLIYICICVLVFLVPLIFIFLEEPGNWVRVFHEWLKILPFVLIFLINNALVFKLFYRKKYFEYLSVTLLTVLLFSFISLFFIRVMSDIGILHVLPPRPDPIRLGPPKTQFILGFVNNILISILVVGLNDAIKIFIQWMKDQHDMVILQRENARNELALLRQQISPHFFMNTLNNIHVLIDYDQEIAKDSVIKLSKLMRVLLYKEETKRFTLKKEIDFLNDYVELMRIRLNDKVDVRFSKPEIIPNIIFPPLLFINFVENAFKHGVKAVGDSFIHINFEIENNKLIVEISNSKVKLVENIESSGKVGLENSKKRLELLFKDNYRLDIVDSEDMFVVKIEIDL